MQKSVRFCLKLFALAAASFSPQAIVNAHDIHRFNAYLQNITDQKSVKKMLDSYDQKRHQGSLINVGFSKHPGVFYFTCTKGYIAAPLPRMLAAFSLTERFGKSNIKQESNSTPTDKTRAFLDNELAVHIKYSDPNIAILGKSPSFYAGMAGRVLWKGRELSIEHIFLQRPACSVAAHGQTSWNSFDLGCSANIDDAKRVGGAIDAHYTFSKGISIDAQYKTLSHASVDSLLKKPGAVQISCTKTGSLGALTVGYSYCLSPWARNAGQAPCGLFFHYRD